MPDENTDYKQPKKHGNQAGTFVGVPNAVHLHIVGGTNTHVRIGNSDKPALRKKVDLNDKDSITAAMDWLRYEKKATTKPGYTSTFEYLRAEAKKHGR